MDKENLDLKTAVQIAKIVATVPESRMPIIWDIFRQAGLDIGGLDEMAEWKALTKQAFLIDAEKFLAGITDGKVDYACPVYEADKPAQRCVCIYSDWRERIKGGVAD